MFLQYCIEIISDLLPKFGMLDLLGNMCLKCRGCLGIHESLFGKCQIVVRQLLDVFCEDSESTFRGS